MDYEPSPEYKSTVDIRGTIVPGILSPASYLNSIYGTDHGMNKMRPVVWPKLTSLLNGFLIMTSDVWNFNLAQRKPGPTAPE